MYRYIDLDDLAWNAYSVVPETRRFISYKDLDAYGSMAIKIMAENDCHVALDLSRDRTYKWLIDHSDLFEEIEIDGYKGLYLKNGKTKRDVREGVSCCLTVTMLKAFQDPRVCQILS